MDVQYLSPLRPDFLPVPINNCHWRIVVPFKFSVNGKLYETPPNMLTDFASVPRVVWSIVDPYDLGVGPVPHDMGYQTGAENKQYWDSVFEACMLNDFVPAWKRTVAYQAVALFGGSTWTEYRAGKVRREMRGEDMSKFREATPKEIAWAKAVIVITSR